MTNKAKMETKAETVPEVEGPKEAPNSEWPEAWLMAEEVDDQKKPNKMEPNVPFDVDALRELGIR